MLVTRLTDRAALTRLVRAALRHEVAQVALADAPRQAQPHTLDLRVAERSALSLVAEPAGAPQNGQFPLRLRPLSRAQAAELYALLEAESRGADAAASAKPDSPVPLTEAFTDTLRLSREEAQPLQPERPPGGALIAAGMIGAAPPVVEDLVESMRATLERLGAIDPASSADPRRTAPMAPPLAAWPQNAPQMDDPRRTAPSATWGREILDEPAAEADDLSVSVSVVFEPDTPSTDDDAQALSVSVVFEPDAPPPTIATWPPADPFDDTEAVASGPPVDVAALSADVAGPLDDDEPETLVRSPASSRRVPVVLPAAGRPAFEPPPVEPDDLTPTTLDLPLAPKRKTTGSGRKKKPTRRGKEPDSDADTDARVGFPAEPAITSRRASRANDAPLVGRHIADGKYVIEELIGAGAAGAVYKAMHRDLRRTVAIKVLHPHYQHDPAFMKSFRAEALAASQLDHPNVMRVLDFGQEPDGLVYIVMEYLSGRTLQSLLDEERRLPPDRAVELLIQVCAALSVAHDNGIIHRDIKPDNIMLVTSRNDEGATFEMVKVCDFGIAALQNPRIDDGDDDEEGTIAGTPEYMSPEQANGAVIDARADVYAAGICLYELVTGRPPFLGDHPAEILVKQVTEPPKPPSHFSKGLDPLLEEVILRAIQKDPGKRHQSARELRNELKELIDPGDDRDEDEEDEKSIVESVPGLDDPGSGFAGFFIGLASAVLRFGRFERAHPEAAQAMKDLGKSTRSALRGRSELTFARRDTPKAIGFCVVSGTAEVVDLKRLLGSQLYGSFAHPFIDYVVAKGIAAMTVREGIPDGELQVLLEMLIGPHAGEELRRELFAKALRHVSVLFVSDVLGRDRKLAWKVGLCVSRLARDLTALSNVRGISLKKMRETRDDLVTGVARLLTRGDEVKQFLASCDVVEEVVANLRGFSSFRLAPLVVERALHEACAEAAMVLVHDFDHGDGDRNVVEANLRLLATRLVGERSPKADAAVTELYKRAILTDTDVPRDLRETIRAAALADALVREPAQFLRTLDMIGDPADYARELVTLEAAMSVLARRGEAGALLGVIGTLARHAKGSGGPPGERETHALRAMKSVIDKQRLLPIAQTLLTGPPHQREASRQLLVLAGSAGVHALYMAREALTNASARPLFVKVLRETGPAGWSLLSAVLPRMEVRDEADVALAEDLLRAMPDRPDPVLGEAVARFLSHPRLRPAALAAIVPLWGDRARKPLFDALEFAEEPARIVAITELRRLRAIDEHAVGIIERLLTMRGSASEELRAAVAAALADVAPPLRPRAVALLAKGVEGKRGFVAILRGDSGSDESIIVVEAMARALLALDRNEGLRALKARIQKSDGLMRARLGAVLQRA